MQQAISTGTVIDKRYQIQKRLPDTTSNHCYLAEDTDQSNRLVVISLPKMELQTLLGFKGSFDDACQRLIKTRLSGLIKVLDSGVFESQPYAVLQYVTHETLNNALDSNKHRKQKSSIDDVLDWARPLAVTLDELHGAGFIHSNVRPSTIFLGQNRQVLLGDFITEFTIQRLGASKQAIASLDIGDHLAPEYIKSNYTESYDQYLLATIIYEALAERSHFHNPGSTEAYRRQVATKFPEPLLNHRPELVGASKILGKALERNPVKRFDSCREFVNQLESGQVNPVFDADKPVTVIKKVLDFDETAPADPIITSIRSKGNRGRKKGFIWLGVLLLGVGASSYAVSHFGGLEQFKEKVVIAWNDLTQSETESPVVIPVDLKTLVDQDVDGPAQTAKGKTESNNMMRVTQTEGSSEGLTNSNPSSNNENTLAVVKKGTDSSVTPSIKAEGLKATKSEQGSSSNTDNLVKTAVTASITSLGSEESTTTPNTNNIEILSSDAVEIAVSQALKDGQEDFIKTKSAVEKEDASVATIPPKGEIVDVVSLALQEAQVEFMRKTSPAASVENELAETATNEAAVDEGKDVDAALETDKVEAGVSDSVQAIPDTESAEDQLSKEELDAIKLNAQMVAANKLADEQAAAAKLKAKEKQRELEVKKAQNDATTDVVNKPAGAAKTFEEMQQERVRLQKLKAEKTARINSITTDCTRNDKIHRQVAQGNLAYVKNCLSVGVNPNLTQNNKWSLLHLASWGGHLNMAKLLVAKGAEVNAKAVDGKTPLDLAGEKSKDRLITYLRSRGGVVTR